MTASASATTSPAIVYHGERIPVESGRDLLGQLLDAGADIGYICMSGSCGTCRIRVISGMEHLAPRTDAEEFQGMPGGSDRLACQAIALGTGDVMIAQ